MVAACDSTHQGKAMIVRVRFQIIRNARIENVCKSQSCMVSKLRIIWKQTVDRYASPQASSAAKNLEALRAHAQRARRGARLLTVFWHVRRLAVSVADQLQVMAAARLLQPCMTEIDLCFECAH